MGGGKWSGATYSSRVSSKTAAGIPAFAYSATVHATGAWKVHDTLDPKLVNGPASALAGKNIRECLDSTEHPNTQPIAVLFDVTGSMGHIPTILQTKLPELLGVVMRKGAAEDPQILFGAIGDATTDRVPLQFGQFESDNRLDENLENIILEGGGGGHKAESYELAAYFMSRHTYIDSWEKRGKKGYLFIVGDETNYPQVNRKQVTDFIGDPLESNIPTAEIYRELQEKWEVFYFQPQDSPSYPNDKQVYDDWRQYLNQHAIRLDDSSTVCEAIAMTIGLAEGLDLDETAAALVSVGVSKSAIASVATALAPLATSGAVATLDGKLDDLDATDSGSKRV